MNKKRVAWNKGLKGVQKSYRKGFTIIEIYGKEKAEIIRKKLSISARKSNTQTKRDKISKTLKEKYRNGSLKSPFSNPDVMRKVIEHNKSRERNIKLSKSLKGKVVTKETRQKLREIRALQIKKLKEENNIDSRLQVGKYETHILDILERLHGYTILRQHLVNGYFLDGYCPVLNLAIEVDEEYHFKNGKLRNCDIERQKLITKEMGCQFLRIKVGT